MFPKDEIKSINSFLLNENSENEESSALYNAWIQSSFYRPTKGENVIILINYIDKMKNCSPELLKKLDSI